MPTKEYKISMATPIQSDSSLVIPGINRVPEFVGFTRWFATPRQLRGPETQKEFAEAVGVCEDTLTDWKRHPQFWPLVQQALSEWMRERIPDAIGGLYLKTQGERCSASDVALFLRLAGSGMKENHTK